MNTQSGSGCIHDEIAGHIAVEQIVFVNTIVLIIQDGAIGRHLELSGMIAQNAHLYASHEGMRLCIETNQVSRRMTGYVPVHIVVSLSRAQYPHIAQRILNDI
jgi:hypothetical protein